MITSGSAAVTDLSFTAIDWRELQGGDNLLQSAFWGSFKSAAGWSPRGFSWTDGCRAYRFLMLERSFPGGLRMGYVPYGPELPDGLDGSGVAAFLISIGRNLSAVTDPGLFMIRFDLACSQAGGRIPVVPETPLMRAPYRVQPQDTVILQLEQDEDALMAGMHRKCRYNIRLAERRGVEIRRHDGRDALDVLPSWYSLYQETGRRDGITIHSPDYYRRMFELAAQMESAGPAGEPALRIYTAHHDDELLGGIIVSRYGRRSTYMYGASSDRKRELMPNHLLQWRAIVDARGEGAAEYDLFGIPPTDDPAHPMHGLWRFKTAFGGEIRHYAGAWDYPVRPVVYRFYRGAERLRGWNAGRRKPRTG